MNKNLYRKCVGMMLMNKEGKIFLGERIDAPKSWQMPQGGIDEGEEPKAAATRELYEETGITNIEIISCMQKSLFYDIPNQYLSGRWQNDYIGQEILFFLIKFNGVESEINLNSMSTPEFRRYGWFNPKEIINTAINFKIDVYTEVLKTFEPLIEIANNNYKLNPSYSDSNIFC